MASYDDVMTALRNADAAGDHEAATRLAEIAAKMKGQVSSAPITPPSSQTPNFSAIPDSTPVPMSAEDRFAEQQRQSIPQQIGAGMEAAVNTGAGLLGVFPSALAAGANAIQRGYRTATGQSTNDMPTFEQAAAKGMGLFSDPMTKASSPLGQEYTQAVGDKFNDWLPGLMHLHTMHVEGAGMVRPADALALRKANKAANVKAPTVNPILDALDKNLPKTETPGIDPNLELYKQRALDQQQAAILEQHLQGQRPILVDSEGTAIPTEAGGMDLSEQRNPYMVGGDEGLLQHQADATEQAKIPMDMPPTPEGMDREGQAQAAVDARAKAIQDQADTLKAQQEDMANRQQASNMDSTPSAEHQAHVERVAAEEAHQREIEKAHADALDQQQRLEEAQKAIENRQKAIDDEMKNQPGVVGTNDRSVRQDVLNENARLRNQQENAPTRSKKQQAIDKKTALEADRQRIVEQRAANEEMIQRLRDQHEEAEIRRLKAEADAQEAINKRNEQNTAATRKAAQEITAKRKQADALAKDLAKRQEALRKQAMERAIQEIAHPAGSKERAAAVKAIKERFSKKGEGATTPPKYVPKGQRGGFNPDVFVEGFQKVKDIVEKGIRLIAKGDKENLSIHVVDKNGNKIGGAVFKPTDKWGKPSETDLSSSGTGISKEWQRKGIAGDVYKFASELGNDIVPDARRTDEGRAMWKGFQKQGLAKGTSKPFIPKTPEQLHEQKAQEAGLFGNKDGIVELNAGMDPFKAINDIVDKIKLKGVNFQDFGRKYITTSFKEAADSERAVGNAVDPQQVIKQATSQGATDISIPKDSTISANLQSGLNMVAAKFRENVVVKAVADHLNNGLAKTNYQVSKIVTPVIKALNRLDIKSLETLQGILQREQLNERVYTDAELKAAGMSDKMLTAYKMQREAYDSAFKLQNEALKIMGEKELSRKDYYYSSRWNGDWHAPITENTGKIDPATGQPKQKLVWYIRTTSKAEGVRAIAYLKEKFPNLNIDENTKPTYRGDSRNPAAPRDVAGAYRDMMGYFSDNPEMTSAIKEAMESYTESKGFTNLGQNKHFMAKANIRGFIGDTPWLSAEEATKTGAKSQMHYLENAVRWANMQKTVANVKQILTNPDVIKQQPNAVAMSQKIVDRELGMGGNVAAAVENGLAKMLGQSRSSVLHGAGDIKTMTYLQTLGFNVMYAISTPLQFLVTGPMWHSMMSSSGGYKMGAIGAIKTMGFGLSDATAAIMSHLGHEMGMHTVEHGTMKYGMTDIGRQALQYMEDSGYIKRNLFDESKTIGAHGPVETLKAATGWTIGKPEQVARITSFMSFVHHLDASGAFKGNNMALFHEAEMYSDRALGSFKSFDRPMAIDKAGIFGQMGYVYQSYKFTSMHTMNAAARQAAKGNVMPLALLMGSYALFSGIMNMPGMQEADGLVNGAKDLIAKGKPNWYTPAVRDFDLRSEVINSLPDTKIARQLGGTTWRGLATHGALGEATGLNIAPHISPQVADTEHISNNFPGAVMAQEMKEWGSIGKFAINPNTSTLTEGIYKNAPPMVKGAMEENLPNIKVGNTPGHQVFLNPNDLSNPKTLPFSRNQWDEAARQWGATSAREGVLKENWYRNTQEDARIKNALGGNMEGLLSAIHRDNKSDIVKYATAYLNLDPEGKGLGKDLDDRLAGMHISQEDQRVIKMRTLNAIQSVQRYRNMPK